ncbi:MAG: glycoside hydrolase family 2 protein [Ruminococcus sp.]|nr:glycoside hydrolase family 2 protein [Ruminococcus sp.]MCM1479956.1 glycoside hydrolase family 2 protein [Muribaculaceae bacterium]
MNNFTAHPADGRVTADFNSSWRFMKLTQKGGFSELAVETIDFDDSEWTEISLPHTWNDIDGADGQSGKDEGGEDYYRGLGGYRKTAYFPESEYGGKSVFIEFEGANTVTELFVNSVSAGVHEGGYAAFRFEITELLRLDGENFFAVKVNNAPTDYIAPITNQGDFTKMGGIYRDVKIIAVPKIHIDLTDFGSSGIYITPKNISKNHTFTDVVVKLANDGGERVSADVSVTIFDENKNIISSEKRRVTFIPHKKFQAEFTLPIENPILWNGTENPYLYTAEITVETKGKILDSHKQNFGVRTYFIDPEKGFFLNGKYLDLRGVNYHQDSFENGWAMTDEQRERDCKMMREMGCNAVRMAHYQHDGYEYDLCDRLGITVWTEVGIVNKMSADESGKLKIADGFKANAKQQLTELIRQNYNHPSVIVWGISNELYQMSDEIFDFYTELNLLAKNEDKTRLTTFADAQFWGRFLELPADVVGYNRYFGWYKDAGPAEKFGEWLDVYRKEKESRPICVSEYGGGAAVSQFKDNIDWQTDMDPWGERHYQNYQSAMHEKIWAQFAKRKYLWGKYIWCMFDFASDGRQEGDTKGQNDKGLVTRRRIPKDSFYFYKLVWNGTPMVHLTEKGFVRRANVVPQIKAYSNAESAELFIDGISRGTVKRTDLDGDFSTVFIWENVKIAEEKESEIVVKGTFADGSVLSDSAVWTGIKT